jgi:hypothetical protein
LGNAGTLTKAYILYSIDAPGTFGKADGIGNVVAQRFPAPLEIGDRVWRDTNGNGIQDAGEPGIANVTVTLFDVTARMTVATTTTDASGDYDFNNSNVAGGLLANHQYHVVIDTTQAALAGLGPTRVNQGVDLLINSKAALAGTSAVSSLTTGGPGQIDHSEDFGFGLPAQFRPPSSGIGSSSGEPPVVDPTFARETFLLGSNGNGVLAENVLSSTCCMARYSAGAPTSMR